MFLDEPTAGLDPLLRAVIWEELHRLQALGRTILVTTQYLGEAEECEAVALFSEGHLIAMAPPTEMRREAMGGEVIEIETESIFDAQVLRQLPMVRDVRQRSARDFYVTTDEAGTALPQVLAAIEVDGTKVTSSREYRPSFDDVFAALVERHRTSLAPAAAEAGEPLGASAPAAA